MMDYKIIVLDLDGTLLNDEKIISKKDEIILKKLHSKGIQIVIATGRNYYMAKKLTERIKETKPIILANNGAISRLSYNDELIEHSYLDSTIFSSIYEEGLKYNLNPVIHVDEYDNGFDMIFENEDYEETYLGYVKKEDRRVKYVKFKPKDIMNILSVCYLAEFEVLDTFSNKVRKTINGEYNVICNRNISNRALLEFLHVNGCKWRALKKYLDRINVKPSEIIAFGDDNNDIELLFNSGLGIAMKNGTESCIKSSNMISKYDNNNSAVSFELSKIFNIN